MNEDIQESTIKFVPRDNPEHPRLGLTAKRKSYDDKTCEHRHTIIDEQARKLTCQDCGVELDPIWKLAQLAHYGMNLDSRIEEIRKHREQQSEARKEVQQRKKDKVPEVLSRTKVGDEVIVETDGQYQGYCRGKLTRIDEKEIWVDSHSDKSGIPVESLVSVRIVKRG